jgi:uncharacterized membrane protein HdeD (DUF308 family)
MKGVKTLTSDEMLVARRGSRTTVVIGSILTVLGIFAILGPMFSGMVTTVFIGMMLFVAGVMGLIFAFEAKSFGTGLMRVLFGGLSILAGIAIMATPGRSLGMLTAVLAVFFLASGIVDIILWLGQRSDEEGTGWPLFSGILSILLGILIIAQWPASGMWAVGIFVGVRIMMHGWMLTSVGRTTQDMLTHLQDVRIEMLERKVGARPAAGGSGRADG